MKEFIQKNRSLIAILVVGILAIGSIAVAFSGVAPTVMENVVIENYNASIPDMGGNEMLGSTGTRFPNGVSTDSTSPVAGEIRGATFTSTGAVTFGGTVSATGDTSVANLIYNGGKGIATTTQADYTLTSSDLSSYAYWDIINMTDTSSLTFTMPATSTMMALLPEVGSTRTWSFHNATTTGDATINFTLVKGAGMELTGIDANVDVIAAEVWMEVTCTQKEYIDAINENIVCNLKEYIAAD